MSKLIRYVGNSVFTDQKGDKWGREADVDNKILTERQFSDSEYASRTDIQFMVDYGEMKTSEITDTSATPVIPTTPIPTAPIPVAPIVPIAAN